MTTVAVGCGPIVPGWPGPADHLCHRLAARAKLLATTTVAVFSHNWEAAGPLRQAGTGPADLPATVSPLQCAPRAARLATTTAVVLSPAAAGP